MTKTLVFNGWAAGREIWDLCAFPHDWVFSYIEELEGLPEHIIDPSDNLILVGFSMGGCYALKTLMNHPQQVRGLVLVSSTPRIMEDKATNWKGMSLRRSEALAFGTDLIFGNNPSPLYAPENLKRGLAFLRTTDMRADLQAFASRFTPSFPVRVLQSVRDPIVSSSHAAFFQQLFPQAQVTLVPGMEHLLPVTSPGLIDAAVNEVSSNTTQRK